MMKNLILAGILTVTSIGAKASLFSQSTDIFCIVAVNAEVFNLRIADDEFFVIIDNEVTEIKDVTKDITTGGIRFIETKDRKFGTVVMQKIENGELTQIYEKYHPKYEEEPKSQSEIDDFNANVKCSVQ